MKQVLIFLGYIVSFILGLIVGDYAVAFAFHAQQTGLTDNQSTLAYVAALFLSSAFTLGYHRILEKLKMV